LPCYNNKVEKFSLHLNHHREYAVKFHAIIKSALCKRWVICRTFSIIIIIGIQPLGRFGQGPELSQSTGISLVRCVLGKFLGVACHCFPPHLDIPNFVTRCLNDARDPSSRRWNCGRECCPVILPK